MHGLLAAISYDPIVHIPIGPLRISPHGIGIAVGFLLGARLMLPEAARKGISEDTVYTILIRAAFGALIGARVAYVINHLGDYADDPIGIVKVWEGGISLLGGIFGAILLSLPVARRLGVNAWRALDAAAPGLALGIIVGRVGDLIVADHLGKATDFFLGYQCPPPEVETASPCLAPIVHQTALYDLGLTCGLLALLLFLRRQKPRYDGFLIVVFGAWYGVGRIIEDFLREDVRRFGLTGSQWTAVATVLTCEAWLAFIRRTPRWGHWDRRQSAEDAAPGVGTDEPPPTMAGQPQDHEER